MASSVKNLDGRLNNDLKKGVAQFTPTASGGVPVGAIMAFGTQIHNDSTNIIRLSSTQVKLLAGKKYRLEASLHGDLSASTYMYYNWFNVTTGLNIGNAGCGVCTTYTPANAVQNTLSGAYISAEVDTVVELKITTIGTGTITLFTSGYVTIEEVEAYIPVLSSTKVAITKNTSGVVTYPIEDLGSGIIETGSNTNGSWIKFSDGTLICWNAEIVFTMAVNSVAYQYSFPYSFYSSPAISMSVGSPTAHWNFYTADQQVGQLSLFCSVITNLSSAQTAYLKYFAIGRWKA